MLTWYSSPSILNILSSSSKLWETIIFWMIWSILSMQYSMLHDLFTIEVNGKMLGGWIHLMPTVWQGSLTGGWGGGLKMQGSLCIPCRYISPSIHLHSYSCRMKRMKCCIRICGWTMWVFIQQATSYELRFLVRFQVQKISFWFCNFIFALLTHSKWLNDDKTKASSKNAQIAN